MHSGLFESVADDGLASRFHHSGADEERFAAELGIAHADGVGLEVGDRSANLFLNRRIARAQPLESGQYGFDVFPSSSCSTRPAAQSFALVLAP